MVKESPVKNYNNNKLLNNTILCLLLLYFDLVGIGRWVFLSFMPDFLPYSWFTSYLLHPFLGLYSCFAHVYDTGA